MPFRHCVIGALEPRAPRFLLGMSLSILHLASITYTWLGYLCRYAGHVAGAHSVGGLLRSNRANVGVREPSLKLGQYRGRDARGPPPCCPSTDFEGRRDEASRSKISARQRADFGRHRSAREAPVGAN